MCRESCVPYPGRPVRQAVARAERAKGTVTGRRESGVGLTGSPGVVGWDKRYTYTVHISEQEDGYHVEVPALPGCQTWGGTYDEAVSNAQEAIQGFLETLARLGKPIPVESRHSELHLNINLPIPA